MRYDYDTCKRMCLKYLGWAVAALEADERGAAKWFFGEWNRWSVRRVICEQRGWRR